MGDDIEYADPDCPGCCGGDKVPADVDYWRCPVCDTEWFEVEPSLHKGGE